MLSWHSQVDLGILLHIKDLTEPQHQKMLMDLCSDGSSLKQKHSEIMSEHRQKLERCPRHENGQIFLHPGEYECLLLLYKL